MPTPKPSFAKRILNKLFFRHLIAQTYYDLRSLRRKTATQREQLKLLNLTGEIIEKKVDHLSQKIDAYSEFEDEMRQRFADMMQKLQISVDDVNGLTLELKEQIAAAAATSRQSDARMTKMHKSLEALDGANDTLASLRQDADAMGLKLDTLDSRLSALKADTQGNGERLGVVGDAVKTASDEIRARHKTFDARLSAVQAHSELASTKMENVGRTIAEGLESGMKRMDLSIDKSAHGIKDEIQRADLMLYRQLEAHAALVKLMGLEKPLPPMRGWAASPDFLLHIYQHIVSAKPRTVVELGSGVSTIIVAAALRAASGGRVYSLDHDASYAEATKQMLEEQGLNDLAAVYHAPLSPWKPERTTKLGSEWQWYAVPEDVAGLTAIDLLVVDGPPKASGNYARYPAIPQFRSQMAPNCTVFLDDARRADEKATARAWHEEWKLELTQHLQEHGDFEKGATILTAVKT